MPRAPKPQEPEFATISVRHHALTRERQDALGQAERDADHLECVSIGHVWVEDPARPNGTICMVCHIVRWP